MSALVVVESMWGNSRAIGEAVARGLGDGTLVVDVAGAPTALPDDVDLLVVGGPTHAFSMSRSATREDATKRGAPVGQDRTGIREWLGALAPSETIAIATFDTRVIKMRKLPGSAAKSAAKEVGRRHLGRLVDLQSFYVEDMEGPLQDGEITRAESWGAWLAVEVPRRLPLTSPR